MFTYAIGGKTRSLQYGDAFVVVRTRDNQSLKRAVTQKSNRQLLRSLELASEFRDKGVYLLKCKDSLDRRQALRDNVRTEFKTEKGIRFAGRALVDLESRQPYVYTENLIVKFKSGTSDDEAQNVFREQNLSVGKPRSAAKKTQSDYHFSAVLQNVYFAKLKEGSGAETVFDTVHRLSSNPLVEYAYPELLAERRFKTVHKSQWHLKETQINGKTINAGISVIEAWEVTKGKGVTVALIDDGVDTKHAEFKNKIISPYDATLRSYDANPKAKGDKHGTACAGVACASGRYASGVAPEARLMPIRLMSGLGSMDEAEAFAWAMRNGADVISCSWGPKDGPWWDIDNDAGNVPISPLTRDVIHEAVTKGRGGRGIVIVFAAGNGNENVEADGYASNDDVIAVAACNDTGKRSVYSDYGQSVWCCFPSDDFGHDKFDHPEPLTPGIYTTDRSGSLGYGPSNYTNDFGGTSSAAPGVAGVVALMLSANPELSADQVRRILKNTSDKIDPANGKYDSSGHSVFYGYGRVNAAKAVAEAVRVTPQGQQSSPLAAAQKSSRRSKKIVPALRKRKRGPR
ncbi:MAG TPA: S8 family serine peptidase [Candidatus Deferrimicrobium sp.]|nr:S8 family serine peptidase [Candidatus Deferrimicrobium sp.]